MKKITVLLALILPLTVITACNVKSNVRNLTIEHETEFGGIYIHKTIDEFNRAGFAFGDSVNVYFSNGYQLNDLPYYNGYYVDAGEKLLVGYPGYPYIKVTINYGDDIWETAEVEFDEDTRATIALNEKGKYKAIQEASDIHYYDERERYDSDVEFANYRNMAVGNMKEGMVYRSASPCDNKHNRASYVDSLMAKDQIKYILNLADTKEKIDGYIARSDFNSPYFLSLYQNEKFFLSFSNDEQVQPLALNMNYTSVDFANKVVAGFNSMIGKEGPFLIHCLEGKDRTGFVCIVLEALLGASYQEIVDDYMLTYKNYYGITTTEQAEKYKIIKTRNVDTMLKFICGDEVEDITTANLVDGARRYLTWGGMDEMNIDAIVFKFKKD